MSARPATLPLGSKGERLHPVKRFSKASQYAAQENLSFTRVVGGLRRLVEKLPADPVHPVGIGGVGAAVYVLPRSSNSPPPLLRDSDYFIKFISVLNGCLTVYA